MSTIVAPGIEAQCIERYSTSKKKVKVPGDWFARGSVGERGTVRFGTVHCARN